MRVVYGIGTGFVGMRHGGRPIGPTELAGMTEHAMEYLSRTFGGVFASLGEGGWMDKGALLREPSMTLTCDGLASGSGELVEHSAQILRDIFRQDSVIVTVLQAETTFVSEDSHVGTIAA